MGEGRQAAGAGEGVVAAVQAVFHRIQRALPAAKTDLKRDVKKHKGFWVDLAQEKGGVDMGAALYRLDPRPRSGLPPAIACCCFGGELRACSICSTLTARDFAAAAAAAAEEEVPVPNLALHAHFPEEIEAPGRGVSRTFRLSASSELAAAHENTRQGGAAHLCKCGTAALCPMKHLRRE